MGGSVFAIDCRNPLAPDLPPAPFIVEALKTSADDYTHHGYMPFGGTPNYREAWAYFYGKRFGVELDPTDELVGLIGSKEGVFNLALAYVNPPTAVLWFAVAVAGFCTGMTTPPRDMLIRACAPVGASGTVFGFVYSGLDLGGTIAPVLVGLLMDQGQPRAVFWFVAVVTLGAVVTVAATRPPRRPAPVPAE